MREQTLYDLCRHSPPQLLQKLKQAYQKLDQAYPDGAQTKLFTLLWEYTKEKTFDCQDFREAADKLLGSATKRYKTIPKLYDTCLFQFDRKRSRQLTTTDHINRFNLFLSIRSQQGAKDELDNIQKSVEHEPDWHVQLHALSQAFRILIHFRDWKLEAAYATTTQQLKNRFGHPSDPEFWVVLDYYALFTLGFRKGTNKELRQRLFNTYDDDSRSIPVFSCLDARMMYALLRARIARQKRAFHDALYWLDLGLALYEKEVDTDTALVRWDLVISGDRLAILFESDQLDKFEQALRSIHTRTESATYFNRYEGLNTYYFHTLNYLLREFESKPLTPAATQILATIQASYERDMPYFSERRRLLSAFTLSVFYFVRQEYTDFERYYWLFTSDNDVRNDQYLYLMRTAKLMYVSALLVNQAEPKIIHSLIDSMQHQLESWKYRPTEHLIFAQLKQLYKAPLGDRKAIWISLHHELWTHHPKDGTHSKDQSLTTFITWLDNRFGRPPHTKNSAVPT